MTGRDDRRGVLVPDVPPSPEDLARRFHEAYERLAPEYGHETRRESAVPWDQVPERDRALMVAVCRELVGKFP